MDNSWCQPRTRLVAKQAEEQAHRKQHQIPWKYFWVECSIVHQTEQYSSDDIGMAEDANFTSPMLFENTLNNTSEGQLFSQPNKNNVR